MTKADIIENVYEKVGGFSKKEAAEIVETVFDTIKETLERGEKIEDLGLRQLRGARQERPRRPQPADRRGDHDQRPPRAHVQAQPGAQERSQHLTSRALATDIPDKQYFKIGEVAEIAGVEPYVLRYWETEFKSIRPEKTRSNQRLYRRRDVETVLTIKHLLYDEGFRIDGAKRRLRELAHEEPPAAGDASWPPSCARRSRELEKIVDEDEET